MTVHGLGFHDRRDDCDLSLPGTSQYIVTQDDNRLDAENGDNLITE